MHRPSLLVLAVSTATLAAARWGTGVYHSPRPTPAADSGKPAPAPELANDSWINADHALRLAELRGRVVLLNFWVFTCGNCTRSLPSLIDFDARYRDQGLTIIGIHSPEFPPYSGEHDRENVRRAMRAEGIKYPVAQDNDHRTWDTYGIRYWPSFVLIDRRGRVRYEGYGELHEQDATYQDWRRRIEALLTEPSPALHLKVDPARDGIRLTLVPEPGVRINARVKPGLELADGTVLRFGSTRLTPDSAYFATPPTMRAPAETKLKGATVRASVCLPAEKVCRIVTFPVDL